MLPVLVSLLLSLSQSAQATRATGTGTIVGRVVDGVSGQRLSGVTVSITGGGVTPAERTVTDGDGQFTFRALPAGAFNIGARRAGYLDGGFGQRRPNGAVRTITLGTGQRRDDVTVELFKPATIAGRITDDAGEPVVKVLVRAYRRTFVGGKPALAETNSDTTDDRGVYRIGRLLPGDYVVAVPLVSGALQLDGGINPIPVRDGGSSATHLPPSNGKTQKFPTTYYAAGQTAAQATIITLDIGDIRRDVDITVRPSVVMNVSGSVTMTRGTASGVQMVLVAAGEDDVAGARALATTVTSAAGTFSFAAIPIGQYAVRALARAANGPADGPQWGELSIALNDKDLNDVALYLRPGSKITGRFEMDRNADDRSTLLSGLTVTLDSAGDRFAGMPPPSATVDASGKTFAFANVLPGRYLIRVGAPSGLAVKSVSYQGRDAWLSSFSVDASDASGIVVTLTDRPSAISGTVTSTGTGAVDARVLVFPQDPQSWTDVGSAPAALRLIDVSATGAFDVRGLPAGDYYLAAFDQDVDVDWQNPAFLQTAARLATSSKIGDGEQRIVDLKIVTIK